MTVCTPDLKEERRLRAQGYEWVAGLDEVGRGAWAGPVTVGVAVVRPRVTRRSMPPWLRDSKMLSEARREDIFDAVGTWCQAWAVGHASPAECDEWGMTEALRVAARRALAGLAQPPEAVLVDGPVNLLRHPDDQPSIGLILCKTHDRIVAEYALQDVSKPIGISEYQLAAALPDTLKGTLPTIEELESELSEGNGR